MGEGGQLKMGEGKVVRAGGGIGDDDHAQAGGVGGLVAGDRILERGGGFGQHVEFCAGSLVGIGRRLAGFDILAANHDIKAVTEAESLEVAIDVIVVRVRGDAEFQARMPGVIEQRDHSGKNGLGRDQGFLATLETGFEVRSVDVRRDGFPRIKINTVVPDNAVPAFTIKAETELIVHGRPRVDEGGFGIQNQAVEIQHQGVEHGAAWRRSRTGARCAARFVGPRLAATTVLDERSAMLVSPLWFRGRVATAAVTCVLSFTLSSMLSAKPDTLNRDEIPDAYKWDFTPIYASWDEWERDMEALDGLIEVYASLQGTLADGAAAVAHAYELGDDIGRLQYKLYRYPQLQRDVDTRDTEVSGRFQRVTALFAKLGTATSWFTPELLAIGPSSVEEWLNVETRLAPYAFPIREAFRQAEHTLDESGEKLMSFTSQFSGTPRSIYQELSTSDIDFPTITLSSGEETTLSYGGYSRVLQTAREQADRRAAFTGHYQTYEANKNTYAAIYNSVLQRDWFRAQARDYPSALAAALDNNHVPLEVYETLVKSVRAGTAPLQRYLKLRRQLLDLDTYHLYDGSLPLFEDTAVYEYDRMKATVLESVSPLGETYRSKMAELLEGRWLDVYENEGKRSGAYNAGVYGVGTYMLMNYNDTMDAVFTFAHEAGHAMHTLLSYETQPFATASYTIFVAEVASTTNERFLLELLLSRTDDPKERFLLLQQAIDDIVGTFYTQVLFADYEWQAHQLVENGQPVTPDTLSEIYTGLLTEYYGDSVDLDELYRYTWARIPHFFNSPYYVYQYATCFASSAKLFNDMTTGDEASRGDARGRYLELLRSGGNDHPMEQLRKAGVDLADPATIQAVVDQMNELVGRLEVEAARINETR